MKNYRRNFIGRHCLLPLLCLLVFGQLVYAQQAPPAAPVKDAQTKDAPAAKPTPQPAPPPAVSAQQAQLQAEMKMVTDAGRIKDPQKKVEALEKAIKTITNTSYGFMARIDLLEVRVKHFAAEPERIRADITNLLEYRNHSASAYLIAARKLMDSGVMLDYAEELSKKALTLFEEESAAETNQQRAKYLSALGLVYQKAGKTKEAEKMLNQVAVADSKPAPVNGGLNKLIEDSLGDWSKNARRAAVAKGLADLAEKKGDFKNAVNYLADAGMFAPMKAPERKRLEDLYRKTHNNSLDGLEELLDEKYHKFNALAFTVTPYKASEKRSQRVVLAEFFTGSGCGPCVAADLAFDAMLKRYSPQELAVLVYHMHIPLPDPMTNAATIARGKLYAINSTPTHILDGSKKTGGGDRERAKAFFNENTPRVDERLTVPAQADLKLNATLANGAVKTSVTVDQIKSQSSELRLQIALVENQLSYTGENGVRIHPMVVRSLAGEKFGGFAVTAGNSQTVEWNFDLAKVTGEIQSYVDDYLKTASEKLGDEVTFTKPMHTINPGNLSVVAFVQDEKTKDVLQAVQLQLSTLKGAK